MLIAHTDTVWDGESGYPGRVRYQNGVYCSRRPEIGIGADDRAGCALVWELRDLGHSVLLVSGEEDGCKGSYWLADQNPDILDELNRHRFLVQFDRQGRAEFKCYDVGTTAFRTYVHTQTGFTEPDRRSTTDIRVLARGICGVNLSVGYHDEHCPEERLVYADWAYTHQIGRRWLEQTPLPRFERSAATANEKGEDDHE